MFPLVTPSNPLLQTIHLPVLEFSGLPQYEKNQNEEVSFSGVAGVSDWLDAWGGAASRVSCGLV